MKKIHKTETFIYYGLGFPVKLINVPMKKVFGEWALDINLGKFQRDILHLLVYKKLPITGTELRFIRKYFELTTTAFGKAFGVTHAAVLKWESGQGRIPPTTEFCVRLFVLDKLRAKNEEFGRLYHRVTIEALAQSQKEPTHADLLEFEPGQKLAFA
jgi:hypothetical protein